MWPCSFYQRNEAYIFCQFSTMRRKKYKEYHKILKNEYVLAIYISFPRSLSLLLYIYKKTSDFTSKTLRRSRLPVCSCEQSTHYSNGLFLSYLVTLLPPINQKPAVLSYLSTNVCIYKHCNNSCHTERIVQ